MHVQIGNNTIAKIRFIGSGANPGLNSGTLIFNFVLDFINSDPNTEIFGLEYELRNCTSAFSFKSNNVTYLLGSGILERPFERRNKWAIDNNFSILLPLSFQQLSSIENFRVGGEVEFDVKLLFDLVTITPSEKSKQRKDTDFFYGIKTTDYNGIGFNLRINKSDWLERLKSMKFTDNILLEAKIPFAQKGSVLEKVKKEFEKARNSFQNGEFTTSVGQCRNVLEVLEKLLQFEKRTSSNPSKDRDLTKAQRFDSFFSGLKKITHLSLHKSEDENEIYTEFNRQEAMTILGTTLLLLEHASQNLKSIEGEE